ncbi:GNAT family N-acetyltransferase [Promethearchaeum syntrophicum]|uniref:GNAT family N-acetyltransferase n=1 Tax=Promethearchaeum syntrophicum TaxID=2594042 RepID=A0A5B9DGN4_9ARCH
MEIKYRTYEAGDEVELAQLFNICFHYSGAGFSRTPKNILWRYLDSPSGKAEEIQIAINSKTNKIVGAISCPIEDLIFNGEHFKSGSVNDVAVLPKYQGKGIAKELLQRTIDFMKREGCKISSLIADPKGHARSHLYLPFGWQDIVKIEVCVSLNISILRYFPIIFPYAPFLILNIIKQNFRLKKLERKFLRLNIKTKIIHTDRNNLIPKDLNDILRCMYNDNSMKNFNGSVNFSKEYWKHFRENPISSGSKPTYIVLYRNQEIIGFSSFTRHWFQLEKIGFRIPLAIAREFIIDRRYFTNFNHFLLSSSFLIEKTIEASKERKCSTLLVAVSDQNRILYSILNNKRLFHFPGAVLMYKNLDKSSIKSFSSFPFNSKPIQHDLGEIWLYP